MASDDEIMKEAEELAADNANEKAELEAACAATACDIEVLEQKLAKLKLTRTAKQTECDALFVSVAMTEGDAFLARILSEGQKQQTLLQQGFETLMEQSVDHFVRQLDVLPMRSYYLPTEGNTYPNLTFMVSADKKVCRIQRWSSGAKDQKQIEWEINLGPRASLAEIGYQRVNPSLTWITDMMTWAEVVGKAPNAPLPPLPLLPDPLVTGAGTGETTPVDSVATSSTVRAPKRSLEEDPRLPQLLKLIKCDRVPSPNSRFPRPGSAFFDYVDTFSTRTRTVLHPDMFVGKRTVLLLGTSCIAHWRISAEGYGCFVDLGNAVPQDLAYAHYDMTHYMTDDPDTVVLQVAGSGWHVKYGPFPRGAAAMYTFVTEEVFDFQGGFRPTYLALQFGTNDLKFCTSKNVPAASRPKNDLAFMTEMKDEGLALVAKFKPTKGGILLGMGSPKYQVDPKQIQQSIPFVEETRPEVLHTILHRVTYEYQQHASKDASFARRNLLTKLVHSPTPLLPIEASVRNTFHLGHIQAPWYGVSARNYVNAIRNGIRMFDADYECGLHLCCGSSKLFGPNLDECQDGINPQDVHSHNGRDRCKLGTTIVRSAVNSNSLDHGFWYSLVSASDRGDMIWTVW